jgi:multidrug efflux pump
VFLFPAFIGGIIGQFFTAICIDDRHQHADQCVQLVNPQSRLGCNFAQAKRRAKDWLQCLIDLSFGWFFWLFNWGFKTGVGVYARIVGLAIRLSVLVLIIYGGMVVLTWWGFRQLPTGFIPAQDKGYLLASIQLPDAASIERTRTVVSKIEQVRFVYTPALNSQPASPVTRFFYRRTAVISAQCSSFSTTLISGPNSISRLTKY